MSYCISCCMNHRRSYRWLGLLLLVVMLLAALVLVACEEADEPTGPDGATYPDVARADKLPPDISKRGPDTDLYPPILHSDEFAPPVPMPGPVNTAGAEDSPFVTPDRGKFYFFFTPDVRVPVEEQLLDSVTGVWMARRVFGANPGGWSEPERVWLNDPGVLSLDGAVAVQDDEMVFASAREGYTGVNLFFADKVNEEWTHWRYAGDRLMQELGAGECHLHGDTLYYHSDRGNDPGQFDLWWTVRDGDSWADPVALDALNSAAVDGWPFVNEDGTELWFTRWHEGSPAVFRSRRGDDGWQEPDLIVSQFAGEPTLDNSGTLYFVHHYYEDGVMIEADIYMAEPR